MDSELGTFLAPDMTKLLDIDDISPWFLLECRYIKHLVRKSERFYGQTKQFTNKMFPQASALKKITMYF